MRRPGFIRSLPATLAVLVVAAPALAFGPDPTTATARFRFVVFNDIHVTVEDLGVSRARLRAAVDEINGLGSGIDCVLVAGDLGEAADSTSLRTELQAARDELDRLVVPYRVTIGNQDLTAAGDDAVFRACLGPLSQRFTFGGMQFVFLSTVQTRTSTSIATAALDSFDLRLAEIGRTDPLIVVTHHPLGPLSPSAATNRASVWARVDSFALRGVVSGHWHGDFEEERNGTWYCTTPALAVHRSNHDDSAAKGYRLVTVLPDYSLASRFYELGHPPSFAPEPPVFAATGNRYAVPGRALRLQVTTRRDLDGDSPSYAAFGLPAGGSFDPAQRLFSWTPAPGQAGFHPGIRFVAADPNGADTLALGVRVLDDGCLYEDFEPQQATWETWGGSWSSTSGELVQTNSSSGSYYCTTPGGWGDFYLEADVQEDAGIGYAGLVFRYLNSSNNYYLWNDGARIQVRRRVAGVAQPIGNPALVGATAGRHHVRVEASGPSFKVYWDGALGVDVVDSTFAAGRVGAVTSQAAARFDNLVVTGCAGLPGRAPVLQTIGPRTATVGATLTVDVAATDPDGDPTSYAAENLPPGAVLDAALHRLTWTPSSAEVGLWADARFTVTDGELDDAESVSFTVIDTARACLYESFSSSGGTGRYLSASPAPVVVTFGAAPSVNFTQQALVRVDGSGAGGLAFRIVDASNYYYVAARPDADEVALWKLSGGVAYELAGGAEVSGRVEDWHLYRVEAELARLRVWIDDVLVFDHVDADPATGGPHGAGLAGLRVQDAALDVDDLVVHDCSSSVVDANDPGGAAPRPAISGLRAFPNPFNPRTTVRFELGAPGPTSAVVFDAAGRRVRTLLTTTLPAGWHEVPWNGADDQGREIACGVYFLRLTAGGRTTSTRLVLLE